MTAAAYAKLDENDLRIRMVADTLHYYDFRIDEFDSYDAAEVFAESTLYWRSTMASVGLVRIADALLTPVAEKLNRFLTRGKERRR